MELGKSLSHRSIPSQEMIEPVEGSDIAPSERDVMKLTFLVPMIFCAADTMLHALAQFVSFPSVSNSISHHEDCRQTAIWLKKCLTQFGAESQLVRASRSECCYTNLRSIVIRRGRQEPCCTWYLPRDRKLLEETPDTILRVSSQLLRSRVRLG